MAEINATGLHCDNPNCDYKDVEIPYAEWAAKINAPCPKCGENLLTQQDYDDFTKMYKAAESKGLLAKDGESAFQMHVHDGKLSMYQDGEKVSEEHIYLTEDVVRQYGFIDAVLGGEQPCFAKEYDVPFTNGEIKCTLVLFNMTEGDDIYWFVGLGDKTGLITIVRNAVELKRVWFALVGKELNNG